MKVSLIDFMGSDLTASKRCPCFLQQGIRACQGGQSSRPNRQRLKLINCQLNTHTGRRSHTCFLQFRIEALFQHDS